MKMIAAIDFACNDPDNGLFAGRAGFAMYGDIEIEAPSFEGFAFNVSEDALRIHRRRFTFVGSREWVGNWCWNRYFLRREDMKALLLRMRANGWRVTCGASRFFHWWNAE